MKRRATLELSLAARGDRSTAYQWLYSALREHILNGGLPAGSRLPATRDLAAQYGISRGTVVSAFDQLHAEGYLEARTGAGTFVSRSLPETVSPVRPAHAAKKRIVSRRLSAFGQRVAMFPPYQPVPTRAFRPHLPALDLFPKALWSKILGAQLRTSAPGLYMGCEPQGYRPLREAVAAYLNAARGARCEPDRVLIVSGVQEALDMTARILIDPGDRVYVESPGYDGARIAFRSAGAQLIERDVDREGMRVGAGMKPARLAYVTPAHQFPLGVTMSASRRLQLLQWAEAHDATIFEDDYDSEYRYQGKPIQALQGLDRRGRVIFAGSFSKVMFPSLRLGYVVVPDDLVDAFAATKSIASRHAQLFEQAALCEFIARGHFARHVRRMRDIYAERLGTLLDESRRLLAGVLDVSPIEAGLQTIGWLSDDGDATRFVQEARSNDVDLRQLGRISGREAFLLGFAAVDSDELRRALIALSRCV